MLGQQHPIEAGVDVRAALRDPLDRREQLVDRPGLQRVAPRAGVQAVVEQVEVAVAGVEDHPELGRPLEQLPGEVDAAAVRELDVDDRDVRLGVIDDVEARGDVRGGSDDLHPALPEQHRETLAQGLVVVDDHQPGHRWARTYPLPGCRAQNTAKACVRAVQHAKNPPKSGGNRTAVVRRDLSLAGLMAKDTEKLIRQLSLISYLMAERRPVTALEIRRDVEGYSGMNEDAFARRFYADRSELESLGIQLTVDRPPDGVAEQENYSLRPENFHLPAIAFTDGELAALSTALSLLDGEFAYAEPLRLALQQLSWGRPSPLQPARAAAGRAGHHRLAPAATTCRSASRRSRPRSSATRRSLFDYYTMERDETGTAQGRPVPPALPGRAVLPAGPRPRARRAARLPPVAHPRQGRVRDEGRARLPSPDRGLRPARRTPAAPTWQFGETPATAEIRVSERIAWQVERHFGRFGEIRRGDDGSVVFATPYADAAPARVVGAAPRRARAGPRPARAGRRGRRARRALAARHADGGLELAAPADPRELPDADADTDAPSRRGQGDTAIRPERFARLVTLASILIEAGRARRAARRRRASASACRSPTASCARTSTSSTSSTSAAARTSSTPRSPTTGTIEVDPEPYSDNFARPARLLPVEAKALVAAIDLIGEHLPEGALTSAREKIVAALGEDPTERGLQVASTGGDDSAIARVVCEAIAASGRCGSTTTSPTRTSSSSGRSSRTRS